MTSTVTQAERITTCSFRAIRYRLDCHGLMPNTIPQATPKITAQVHMSSVVVQLPPGPV